MLYLKIENLAKNELLNPKLESTIDVSKRVKFDELNLEEPIIKDCERNNLYAANFIVKNKNYFVTVYVFSSSKCTNIDIVVIESGNEVAIKIHSKKLGQKVFINSKSNPLFVNNYASLHGRIIMIILPQCKIDHFEKKLEELLKFIEENEQNFIELVANNTATLKITKWVHPDFRNDGVVLSNNFIQRISMLGLHFDLEII